MIRTLIGVLIISILAAIIAALCVRTKHPGWWEASGFPIFILVWFGLGAVAMALHLL